MILWHLLVPEWRNDVPLQHPGLGRSVAAADPQDRVHRRSRALNSRRDRIEHHCGRMRDTRRVATHPRSLAADVMVFGPDTLAGRWPNFAAGTYAGKPSRSAMPPALANAPSLDQVAASISMPSLPRLVSCLCSISPG